MHGLFAAERNPLHTSRAITDNRLVLILPGV